MKAGESFGEIESVKAVSDLYSPVERQGRRGQHRSAEPLGNALCRSLRRGWMVKIQLDDPAQLDALMDYAAYQAYQKQAHEEGQ